MPIEKEVKVAKIVQPVCVGASGCVSGAAIIIRK